MWSNLTEGQQLGAAFLVVMILMLLFNSHQADEFDDCVFYGMEAEGLSRAAANQLCVDTQGPDPSMGY